jgi:hypothetical protein
LNVVRQTVNWFRQPVIVFRQPLNGFRPPVTGCWHRLFPVRHTACRFHALVFPGTRPACHTPHTTYTILYRGSNTVVVYSVARRPYTKEDARHLAVAGPGPYSPLP